MKIEWRYNEETEAARIAFTCTSMALGNYDKLNFYVIPIGKAKRFNYKNVVYLPDVAYDSIDKYWDTVRKLPSALGAIIPPAFLERLTALIKYEKTIPVADQIKIRKNWEKIEKIFMNDLKGLFPEFADSIQKAEIIISRYGTTASYNIPMSNPHKTIIVIRNDQSIKEIARMFVMSAVHYQKYTVNSTDEKLIKEKAWLEKIAITDFIIENTSLSRFFRPNNSIPSFSNINELKDLHNRFMNKLGFPTSVSLDIKDGNIVNTKTEEVIDNLTISEEKVIKKLIEMEGKVVSYEDLGEYIWDNKVNQKYSMYAISQLICKLRKKLRQNKIYGEILHTVRGKGFVLTN